MRSVAIVVVALGLSGCGRAGEEAYRASVECAANELVLQDFVAQQYDPARMQPAEASRTVAFNRAALRLGAASGRSGGAVNIDVRDRIAALRVRYSKGGSGEGAAETLRFSQACQAKFGDPAGARAYRPPTSAADERLWQE